MHQLCQMDYSEKIGADDMPPTDERQIAVSPIYGGLNRDKNWHGVCYARAGCL